MAEARTLETTLPVEGKGRVGTAWWGMVCLIATEGIVFAYLIFSYSYLGTQQVGSWPPQGPPSLKLALPATVILIGSSFVLEWGKRLGRDGRMAASWIAILVTFLMGAAFAALELKEWAGKPFSLGTSAYSSAYFLVTGTHLAHVAVGLLALLVLFVWAVTGQLEQGHHQHRAIVTLYWHFVDAVWVFVFATIYLSPRLT